MSINKQNDLRSAIVKEACQLLEKLSTVAGNLMAALMRDMLTVLLQLMANGNSVGEGSEMRIRLHLFALSLFIVVVVVVARLLFLLLPHYCSAAHDGGSTTSSETTQVHSWDRWMRHVMLHACALFFHYVKKKRTPSKKKITRSHKHKTKTQVIVAQVDSCMKHVIRHTRFPRQLKEIEYRVRNSRSKDLRESVGSYVFLMLSTWPAASMDKDAQHLENIISVRSVVLGLNKKCSWSFLTEAGSMVDCNRQHCDATGLIVRTQRSKRCRDAYKMMTVKTGSLGEDFLAFRSKQNTRKKIKKWWWCA